MKKIVALAVVCSVLSGCHYLGEPEAYTVVDEKTAVAEPQAIQPVQPIRPVQSMSLPTVIQSPCGCGYVGSIGMGACQINPGVSGPLVIRIPEQSICIR